MKPRACSKCGDWYNPKFQGTDELCGKCVLKERLDAEAKSKNSASGQTEEAREQQPQTTYQPPQREKPIRYKLNESEYRGECAKCGLWLEGKEVYSQERGWIMVWLHVNYDKTRSKYCLAA